MKYFLICFFSLNFLFAKKVEGYYINNDKERINAIFDIPVNWVSEEINFGAIQFQIKYFDENDKKQKLNLSSIYEIGFEYMGEKIVLRSLQNTIELGNYIGDSSYILLRLMKEDLISEYSYSGTGYMVNASGTGSFYSYGSGILVKKDGTMADPSTGSFKKRMSEFFSDCPELAQKINDKIYKRKDLYIIIEEYKNNCYKE